MRKYLKKFDIFEIYKKSTANSWVIAALLGIMLFHIVAVCYADITVYARYGLIFLDSLFDGKAFSFYMNAEAAGIAPKGAVYDIGLYFIYGIWNIPLWIIDKVVGINPIGVGALLWYKILLVIFLIFCMIRMYDIGKLLGLSEEKSAFGSMCFAASLLTFMPIYVASQCDVIPLAFLLSAVYYIFNNDKTKMLIYVALALLTKPFSFLMLVLLVVLYQKNILKIILEILLGAFPMLFFKIVYSMVQGTVKGAESHMVSSLEQFLEVQIPGGNGSISLFVVGYIILLIMAYLSDMKTFHKYEGAQLQYFFRRKTVIYLYFLWFVFCIFARIYPYWAIYLAPFAILVMLLNKDTENAMLFELIFEGGLTLMLIMNFSWVYGGEKTYTYTILSDMVKKSIEADGGVTVAGVLRRFKVDMLMPAINAATLVCGAVVGILALKDSYQGIEEPEEVKKSGNEWKKAFNIQYALRVLVIGTWLLLSLATFAAIVMR